MYSDSWGGVGWTIVDYYLRKKASYYFVRRVFRPVLISVQQENRQLTFWLTNDTLQEITGTFEYGLVQLSTSSIQRHTLEVKAEPNASQQVAELNVPEEVAVESGRWMAYCRFIVAGQVVCFNRHFLVGFQLSALNLPQASFTQQLDGDVLVLQAETFTWQVRVEVPRGVEVDDNYFDLLPGEERRISLSGPKELFRQVQVSALNEIHRIR
jgi:beta-mannosidase